MKKMKRLMTLLLSVCLVLSLLSSCGMTEEKSTLRVALPDAPATLDPAMVSNESEEIVVSHLYENLMKVSVDANGNYDVVSGLARSYSYGDNLDGTQTYTFLLRDGVTWSDGKAVTAHDFVYAWQRLVNPATGSPNAYLLEMVAGYDAARSGDVSRLQVSAADDQTLVVTLKQRCTYFVDVICSEAATMPVRSDVVEKENWSVDAAKLVTNGAYRVSAWENGVITADMNENYYDAKRLGPDALEIHAADAAAAMEMYENDQVDFVLGLTDDAVAAQDEEWKADSYPLVGTLVVNQMAEGTLDAALRQAMSLVLDRNAIADAMGARRYWAAEGLIPYGISSSTETDFRTQAGALIDNDPEHYEANCTAAAELAKTIPAAGQVKLVHENTDLHTAAAKMIQSMWKEQLDLQVELVSVSRDELVQVLRRGEFTVALVELQTKLDDASAFLNSWTSAASGNYAHIHNTAYDLLMRISSISTSAEAREAYLEDAERMLLESGFVIPVYQGTTTWLLRDDLTKLYGDGMGHYYFFNVVEKAK